MEKLFRFLVLFMLILQLLWFFIPWNLIAYDDVSIRAYEWLGYGALISNKAIIIISNVSLVFYLIISIGLFFYNIWARRFYTILTIFGGVTLPLYGLWVESGYESVFSYFVTLGDGFILALCYFTSISNKFTQKKCNE